VQRVLKVKWIGEAFFNRVARPATVRKILHQAYGRKDAVTDELIDLLMVAAQDAGAAGVFVTFAGYSQGPLPEDLLEVLPCPAIMLWGEVDPWEPIALGKEFAKFPQVQQFIPLPGVGHCPQDEAPELVNPILQDWILQANHLIQP
jgi:pimeloyl-ACP methyl ester carboxylesterase